MCRTNLLFDEMSDAVPQETIDKKIDAFGDRYNNATQYVIQNSEVLDENGDTFAKCAARLLSSFKMTRGGCFQGVGIAPNGEVKERQALQDCWDRIGNHLVYVNRSVRERVKSGYTRDRYLLDLREDEREELIAGIWSMTKQLLPITMGDTSHGLVGASKVLFAVLPEVVLPVDTSQWSSVFKTVDLGDVIRRMVSDIQEWEHNTRKKLDETDSSGRLTTLPSVYNVMAMDARPKVGKGKSVKQS